MQRWLLMGLALGLLMTGVVAAKPPGIKVPLSIARIKAYEKVKGEAKTKKKPIAIVIGDETATDENLPQDMQFAFQRARTMGLLMYVDLKELAQLPDKVGEAAGGLRGDVPAMIFVDPDTEEVIVTVKHIANYTDWEKEIRNAKKQLSGEAPSGKANKDNPPGKDTKPK